MLAWNVEPCALSDPLPHATLEVDSAGADVCAASVEPAVAAVVTAAGDEPVVLDVELSSVPHAVTPIASTPAIAASVTAVRDVLTRDVLTE